MQLLVESHSDHFLNGLRLAVKQIEDLKIQVYYFDPSISDGYMAIDVDNRGMLSDWPAGFFDEATRLLSQIVRP
ncbi:hypothetical protein AWB94_31470 [Mycolicibacterium canariasense]|nr:hypothetical protein AWB94_31470 [Mycolicibacterium canariasense]